MPLRALPTCLLATVLAGCTQPPTSSLAQPAQPDPTDAVDAAVTQSVQAYLKTFKLKETELAVGLSIPWAWGIHWGTAKATGKIGPGGHEVYDVNFFKDAGSDGVHCDQGFLEIAPEAAPSAAPSK